MSAVERIKQFISSQKISERQFYLKVGLPTGSFAKTKGIGSENLMKISIEYPELNMDWVITGRGEIFNIEKPEPAPKEKDWKVEYDRVNQKYLDLLEKYTEALEQKDSLKQTESLPMVAHKS